MEFRKLKATEIDCRVGTISEKGLTLLLYKDARCDMNILDETVGALNWKREHTRDNANCIVSIWDEEKKQWVSKEDTGTESNTEKEKGLASDSFKRACFNWGIGRELYTSPFIWISSEDCKIQKNDKSKLGTYDKFYVKEIKYNESGEIETLVIINQNKKVVYQTKPKKAKEEKAEEKAKEKIETKQEEKKATKREQLIVYCKENKINMNNIAKQYGLNGKSTEEDFEKALLDLGVIEYAKCNNR